MKPIKLKMTGFESYCDPTTIEFEKLGSSGIYLITGDTGSGKTTIFDAITYALYGEPSGENRKEDMLRSDFADPGTPTEVELEFESNNKKYYIKRNPTYQRNNKKGDGTTEEKSNAVLTFLTDSRTPIEGTKKVTAAVEEILHLSKDQFCKIAMIAQGAFQKMLLANTKDKMNIFRELFDTTKYETLSNALKEESKNAYAALCNEKSNLAHFLSLINCDEQDVEYEKIQQLKNSPLINADEIEFLKQFVKSNGEKLGKVVSKIEKLEKEIQENESKIENEKQRQKLVTQKNQSELDVKAKETNLKLFCEKLQQAEENAKQKDVFTQKQTRLEDSLEEYEKVSAIEKELSDLKKETEALTQQNEKDKILLTENDESLKTTCDKIEELKDAGLEKFKLEEQISKTNEKINDSQNISQKISVYMNEQKNYEKAIAEYKLEEEKCSKAEEEYSKNRKLYNAEQAGILAETLKEGFPCPVCGSTTHPHKAEKSLIAPTEEEVNESEKRLNLAKDIAHERSNAASNIKTRIEEIKKQIVGELKKIFPEFSAEDATLKDKINEQITKLNSELSETKKLLEDEQQKLSLKENLERKKPELEKQHQLLTEKIQAAGEKIAANSATIASKEKEIEERKNKLEFSTCEQAKTELEAIKSKISQLEKALNEAQNNKINCEKEISELNGTIKKCNDLIASIPENNMSELLDLQAKQNTQKLSLNKTRDNLNQLKGTNENAVLAIEQIAPKITVLTERHSMIENLSKITSGKNGEKISLETYVQTKFLDEITRHANLRLRVMTDKKYELVRRTEKSGGNAQSGLDFNIKDFFTGRERNVESLSGGEQFQSSLALALGLADEIQKSSGGIKLDTMFIDEGFGTLDSDTLNKSMKALEDLSKANKQIGIISHVEQLEERIPNKIKVTKDKLSGKSSLVIETEL